MKKHWIIYWIWLLPCIAYGQKEALPEVCIKDTEVRFITSAYVEDMTYEIHIALPERYSASTDNYPVVYYLDAHYWGGIVIETYRLLRAFNEIPPLILVGISYPDASGEEARFYRSRDFIPTEINEENFGNYRSAPPVASGGAEQFLAFMKRELKPMINELYRTDRDESGIIGYSLGALFGTYVLFNEPSTFNKYVLGSPDLEMDDYITLKYEEVYFEHHPELATTIFLSVGTLEWERIIVSWIKLKNRLESRNYKGLDLIVKAFDGENHTSNIPGTISRGFRALYGKR